jgi:hypothetical protein
MRGFSGNGGLQVSVAACAHAPGKALASAGPALDFSDTLQAN